MATPLPTVYEKILTSLGCEIENDHVFYPDAADLKPVLVDKLPLVIPTKHILRDPKIREYQAFHPLCESITLGESPVIRRLRKIVAHHLNMTLGVALLEILTVCVDKSRHGSLTPDQLSLLAAVPDVDQKTVDLFRNLITKIKADGDYQLVSIYLKRKATINGHVYNRGAMISFPIIEELAKTDSKQVFGIDIRAKDKRTLKGLFEWILPGASTELYSRGSNSDVAPYFDALMKCFLLMQHYINAGIKIFASHLELGEDLLTDISWAEDLDDLSRYVGHIPPLTGNEGARAAEPNRATAVATSSPTRAPSPQEPPPKSESRPNDRERERAAPAAQEPKRDEYRDNPGSGNELQDWTRQQMRTSGRQPPFGDRNRDRDYRDRDRDYDDRRRREPEPLFGENREQRREEERRRQMEEDRYYRRGRDYRDRDRGYRDRDYDDRDRRGYREDRYSRGRNDRI